MKSDSSIAACIMALQFLGSSDVSAGQAMVIPVEDLVNRSQLVAIVDVKEVAIVEVPSGDEKHQSNVYVAHAQIEQVMKPDRWPDAPGRHIAVERIKQTVK